MLETLNNLDKELLLFVNHLNNPFLDFIFYWISDKWIWIPFYAFLTWQLYRSNRSIFYLILIFIAAAITVSDQISSALIKEHVMRLRPCHDPSISAEIHLVNNYCGGQYGFISSHAANVFTLAAFLCRLFTVKKMVLKRIIWIWAIVVSFSRIYLGAHFPGDVLCGVLLGIILGYTFEWACLFFAKKYLITKTI